jgi:hypothetical protein
MGLIEAIVAFASIASTGMQASAANKKKVATKPQIESASIGNEGEVAAQRMGEMRRQQAGRGGRASTIMSGSPLGQPSQANTAKKILTGQ